MIGPIFSNSEFVLFSHSRHSHLGEFIDNVPQIMHLSPNNFGALHFGHNPLSLYPNNHHKEMASISTIIGIPTIQSIAKPMSIDQRPNLMINNLLRCYIKY